MRFLTIISLFFLLLIPGCSVKDIESYESITNCFDNVKIVNVIVDNQVKSLNKNNSEFELIMKILKDVTDGAHDMPAFAVSLDDLVRDELKSGIWIELEFEKAGEFNDLPFETLLIKVEKDIGGFNLIRGYSGKYEGRCFYLSLRGTMNDLYDILV